MEPIDLGKVTIHNIQPVPGEDGTTAYRLEYTRNPGRLARMISLPNRAWGFLDTRTIAAFIIGMPVGLILTFF